MNIQLLENPHRVERDTAALAKVIRANQGLILRIVADAQHLAPAERDLVCGVYQHGMSASGFARAVSIEPRRIRERLQRIVGRLASPAFQYVLRHGPHWPAPRRDIARAVILHGLTQKQAADATGMSLHRIRTEIERIRALCSESDRSPAPH